jgi:hypothetical protein
LEPAALDHDQRHHMDGPRLQPDFGEARGVDAVIERAQRIVSYGLTFTLKRVLIGQHGLALSLHNTAKRGDVVLDEHLATVCILQDGKICAIHTYLSDVNMLNAFFV